MKIARRHWLTVFAAALFCALLAAPALQAQQGAKKEHAFKGVVRQVDAKAKTVTVDNEAIPGWMMSMTMAYGVDKEAVLKQVKAGDQITATVYDGDFKTLYNVKVAPASSAPDKSKKK